MQCVDFFGGGAQGSRGGGGEGGRDARAGKSEGRAEFGCVRERYIMEYARGLVAGNMEYARGLAAGNMDYAHRRGTIAMLGGRGWSRCSDAPESRRNQ